MKKYTQKLKVRSYELDAQGHVNYAVYLNYCEYARVATMEQAGMPFDDFIKKGKFVVVVEANIKYQAPAFLGDELEITLEGVKAGKTSITFRQEIFNVKTGKRLIDAQMVAVFIDRQGKPVPMDEDFRAVFFD
ncbi:YbgC/FadM family acyl-CoA thioesterase [candidate division KSB1 bacterium]|nr:YbgC/FadM family acyl-CoA thioesterase [candidate division KSB1 bacterium]